MSICRRPAEVDQPLAELGRAVGVGAEAAGLLLGGALGLAAVLGPGGRAADRADGGRDDRLGIGRPLLGHRPDDLRDDLTRLLDDDRVADPHVAPGELAEVVQRGVGDRRARHADRLHPGPRRELAGLADLDLDAEQPRGRLFGGVLEGDDPTRGLARGAQEFLQAEVVDLEDGSVGLEAQRVAAGAEGLDAGPGLLEGADGRGCRAPRASRSGRRPPAAPPGR